MILEQTVLPGPRGAVVGLHIELVCTCEVANIIIDVYARIVAVASELEEDGVELGFNNRRRSSAMLFVMKSPIMQ